MQILCILKVSECHQAANYGVIIDDYMGQLLMTCNNINVWISTFQPRSFKDLSMCYFVIFGSIKQSIVDNKTKNV